MDWVAAIVSIIGAYLVGIKKIHGFYLWVISNTYWVVHNYVIQDYAQMSLFIVYLITCIFGIYHWGKDDKK